MKKIINRRIFIDKNINFYSFGKNRGISPIEKILVDAGIGFELTEINYADYLVLGPHSDLSLFVENKDKIIIFVTGEAATPDFNLVDYAFGYDPILFGDRYRQIYFQYLFFDINIGDRKAPEEIAKTKTKFCNFIYSNGSQAVKMRDDFFHKLSAYKNVDSLGSHLKNVEDDLSPPYMGNWFKESVERKTPYKFSIAFENAFHAGYTTEKLFSSIMADTIPIYWGNPEVGKIINTRAIINCHEFDSFDDVIKRIKEIDENDDEYIKMLKEPWFKDDLQKGMKSEMERTFKQQIIHIFSQDYEKAFRKPRGAFNDNYRKSLINSVVKERKTSISSMLISKLNSLVKNNDKW